MAVALSRDLPRFAAIALALATVPLLWAPWVHVESEPMCIMADPCPGPEQSTEDGSTTAGAAVTLLACGAVVVLAAPRSGLVGRWAATLMLGGAAVLALYDPDGWGFRVFEHVTGIAWGAVAAAFACLAAAALAAATALLGSRPAATGARPPASSTSDK